MHTYNSIDKLDYRIFNLLALGAKNRDMAIRWLHDSYGTDGNNALLAKELDVPLDYFL